MFESLTFLEILIATVICLGCTVAAMLYLKKSDLKDKVEAQKEYHSAIKNLSEDPGNDDLLEECYRLGDKYFSYVVPDVYSSPLPGYGLFVETISNSEERKKLIDKDINDALDIVEKYKDAA